MEAALNFYEQLTSGRYGSMELKRIVGPNLLRGLLFSVIAHALIVGAPWIVRLFQGEDDVPPPPIRVVDISQLTKLKSMQETNQTVQIAQTQLSIPKAAIPVAVAEDVITEEIQIASQSQIAVAVGAGTGDEGLDIKPGERIEIREEEKESDEIPDAKEFVPFEVAPQPLPNYYKQPAYPKMAMQAGVKGRVIVQIYVDKTGVVKRHSIVKETPENLGFKEEVEKVIGGWKFTPAIQNGKPIGVWIEFPVNFTFSN
jgi:protein TonB